MFATDITLSFFTAYYDQEVLITDHKMIARNYLRCVTASPPVPWQVKSSFALISSHLGCGACCDVQTSVQHFSEVGISLL